MTRPSRWDHPRWHLVFVAPILILVIVEDDAITRGMAAVALALSAFRSGGRLGEAPAGGRES